ncbi:hypothetical protein ACFU8Q_13470 [Streptomyces sp. NPDC057543]|uniref:hypothetical protein n=1 Tax=Streptomyces sp. NPDC057543 TaxID=3346163 RepID=UPI0036C2EAAB
MLNQSSRRPWWPFALLGVACLAFLAAVGLWVIGVFMMSDPEPQLVGVRIDGSRITVKAPTCPGEAVEKVQVFDNAAERLLWQASAPRSVAGRRGEVTLWDAEEFLRSGPAAQPHSLPEELDVSFTIAESSGGPGVAFSVPEVTSAQLPEGQFWTNDGPMSAEAIDRQVACHAYEAPSS